MIVIFAFAAFIPVFAGTIPRTTVQALISAGARGDISAMQRHCNLDKDRCKFFALIVSLAEDVRITRVETEGRNAVVYVLFYEASGARTRLIFTCQKEWDGNWKVVLCE